MTPTPPTPVTLPTLLAIFSLAGSALAQPQGGKPVTPKPPEQATPAPAQPTEPREIVNPNEDLSTVLEKPGEITLVALGFRASEGPLWDPEHSRLLVCDMSTDGIYGVPLLGHPLKSDELVAFRVPSEKTWGIARDADNGILCAENSRKVEKTDKDGKNAMALATEFEGKPLNNPNDIVAGSAGGTVGWVYFTDPPFSTPREGENLPFHGVFRVSSGGSKIEALARDLQYPNGLAFNAGCTKLYVSEYSKGIIHEYPVKPDGSVGEGKVFVDMSAYGKRADGLKLDTAGNVYATGGGAVQVFKPDGTRLGRIAVPGSASNVAFGGEDGRSLFVTCGKNVVFVRTKNPGANLAWLKKPEAKPAETKPTDAKPPAHAPDPTKEKTPG